MLPSTTSSSLPSITQNAIRSASPIETAVSTEPNRNNAQHVAITTLVQCANGACDEVVDTSLLLMGRSSGILSDGEFDLSNRHTTAKRPRRPGQTDNGSSTVENSNCVPLRGENGNAVVVPDDDDGWTEQTAGGSPYVCGKCNLLKNVGKSFR